MYMYLDATLSAYDVGLAYSFIVTVCSMKINKYKTECKSPPYLISHAHRACQIYKKVDNNPNLLCNMKTFAVFTGVSTIREYDSLKIRIFPYPLRTGGTLFVLKTINGKLHQLVNTFNLI